MTDYPLISVVISTHNREERLKRAVRSVLEQTYPNIEVIVVDDASTDATGEFMSRSTADHKNVKCIKLEKNFGNDTRPKNMGTLEAKGDWIAYLDDDNEFLPDHLMILYQESLRNPDMDIIYGDRLALSDDSEVDPSVGASSDFSQPLLFLRNFIDTSDVLVRKSAIFEIGGWDERYKKYVDWNLWVRLCKAGFKFHHVKKVITNYYLNKDAKSLTVKDRMPDGTQSLPLGNAHVFFPEWNAFELEIRLPYLGEKPKPTVAVFTLTYGRLMYTKVMYESLKKAGYPLTWIVVDNGSTDGTVEWLQGLKPEGTITDIQLILNKDNKGISISSNQALDQAEKGDFTYVIKIDNDAEVLTDDWLNKLLHIFQAHDKIVLSPYVEGLIDNPGGTPRIAYKKLRGHLLGITPHIGGIFTMAHKSAYKGFRWDENDPLHALQDMVFTQSMQKKDYLIAYVEDMRVSHQESSDGQKQRFPDYFEKRKEEKRTVYDKNQQS